MSEKVDLFVVQQLRSSDDEWEVKQSPYDFDNGAVVFGSHKKAESVCSWFHGKTRIVRILGEVVDEQ